MSSVRVDTVPWIPGFCIVGNTGLGVIASTVPTGGANGPPFGYGDLQAPDLSQEVRWLIRTWPSAGTLTPAEDGSFVFDGAPPGTYSFYVDAYLAGKFVGTKLVVIAVGPGLAPVSLSLDLT